MNSFYKVGIIIPAYNVESYIFRALDSCINQSYKNIEIIVVDDGSSDSTYDVLKSYADRDNRIKLFRQENAGVSAARNKALDLCESDYVIFLDSDDWLELDAIETLVEKIDPEAPNSSLISCSLYDAFLASSNIEKTIPTRDAETLLSSEEALMYTVTRSYHLVSSCYKLYSMSVINSNKLRFAADISHGEDGLFVFEYLKNVDKFAYFPQPLWNILNRPGSASRMSYSSTIMSAITAVVRMLEYGNNSSLDFELRKFYVRRILSVLSGAFVACPTPSEDIKVMRKMLRAQFGMYMFRQKELKPKLLYLFETFAPRAVVAKYFEKITSP